MKAIIIEQYGGPEKLAIQNLPDPEPKPGNVVIAVKAFGINHAETHMRKGEWAEAAKVSGIECVGVVKACPGGEFNADKKSRPSWAAWDGPLTAATLSTPRCQSRTL